MGEWEGRRQGGVEGSERRREGEMGEKGKEGQDGANKEEKKEGRRVGDGGGWLALGCCFSTCNTIILGR